MSMRTLTTVIAVTGVVATVTRVHAAAPPQLSKAFRIDHADPQGSVPGLQERNAKPIEFGYYLQDLAAFAATARRQGDRALESRYNLALAKAVPDRATGFSRACESLEAAGKKDEAIAACRNALALEGVELKDYVRFVRLMLAKQPALTAMEREELTRTIAHLQSDPQSRVASWHLQCEVALHTEDFVSLEVCARALERVAPNDTKTITFLWALAAHQGNYKDTQILIARARSHGVAPQVISRMEIATRNRGWRRWVPDRVLPWTSAAIAVALAAVVVLLVARLRRPRHQSVADLRS